MSGTPVRPASTQEKIHRQKTKEGDTQAGYLQEKLVGSEYVTIVEEDGSVGKRLKVEVDASALGTAIDSGKVLVSSTDTTKDYLLSKLVAGNAITLTEQNHAGNENILIDGAYVAGAGISIVDDTIASTITQVVTEDTFTGSTSKVPTSQAVADLLKSLTITSAADCGGTGNALIHKVKDIPLGSCSFVEDTSSPSFTDHYPTLGSILSAVPTWDTSGSYGRGKGNSLLIFSTEEQDVREYTAAVCNLSIDEDIDMLANSNIYVDVLFECLATGEENSIANVKCQPVFYDGTTLLSALPYLPAASIKQVELPKADSRIRKITYEITLGDQCNAYKWLYGALVFTCDASADSKRATIIGLRVRYATKTIGLREVDVEP